MLVAILGAFGPWEIGLIVLLIVLLFGGKKIPELMRGVGKGLKSFKEGMNEADTEIKKVKEDIERDSSSEKKDNA